MRCVLDRDGSTEAIRGRPLPAPVQTGGLPAAYEAVKQRDELQRAMTLGAGVLRSAASLDDTARVLDGLGAPADPEVRNLLTVGSALLAAARAREESRGAHTRVDFPDPSPAYRVRLVLS